MVKKVRRWLRNGDEYVADEEKSDKNSIFREFLRSPLRTGAVTASSQALAEQVIAPIGKRGNPVVVELGPGTGAFTTAIQRRLGGRGSHLAVELNPRLADALRRRYPDVDVVCGNATDLTAILAERDLVADVVVSGLPWTAYPVLGPPLPAIVAASLRSEGVFTQFTYTWSRWAPPARRQQRWLHESFEEVVRSRTVWRNLPPALVYLARRPQPPDGVVGNGRGRTRPAPQAVSPPPPAEALGGQVFEAVLVELVTALEGDPDRSELLVRGASAAHRAVSHFHYKESTNRATCVGSDDYWDVPAGERLRLARDLHDWVGSAVSLALRQLDLHMIDRGRDDPAADRRLLDTRRTLEEVLGSLRRLVSDLREQRGTTSLAAMLEDFVTRANLLCAATTVQVRGDESHLPARVRDELFIVVREALRNAFVHAQAGQVDVTIDIAADCVRARVEDNGVGFGAGRADSPGNGLASMRERIEMLGGSLVIAGGQPSGTRIDVVIHLRGVPGTNDS